MAYMEYMHIKRKMSLCDVSLMLYISLGLQHPVYKACGCRAPSNTHDSYWKHNSTSTCRKTLL